MDLPNLKAYLSKHRSVAEGFSSWPFLCPLCSVNADTGSAAQGRQSTESTRSFLEDGQDMRQQTPYLEATHSQEWPDRERRQLSTGQPPTKSLPKQKSKNKENIR